MIWNVGGFDPVALDLGVLQIRWYALSYIAGILAVFKITPYLAKKYNPSITTDNIDDFFTWAVLGIVIGGRLGYVLFYQPEYYLSNPIEVLFIYKGGMAFHGGFLGVVLAGWLYCKKYKIDVVAMSDIFVVSIPLGLMFGRLANFVNGELWGRVTDGTWGVIFPNAGDLPRHPSQLYEAFLEGFVLFVLLYILVAHFEALKARGFALGVFVTGYGFSRILAENFREPDAFIGYLSHGTTMGQWLSIPMIIVGATFMRHGLRNTRGRSVGR